MADDGGGDWRDLLVPELALLDSAPTLEVGNWVPEGMWWNNGVVDGMEGNDVVQGMGGTQGDEFMVGAAGSNGQRSPSGLREQGPVSNGNNSGLFEFDVVEGGSSLAVHAGNKAGMAGQGPVSGENYSRFEFGAQESSMAVQVPQSTVKLRNKSGAKRKAGRAPPGSPRQRSQSGSKEMAGGGSNEDYSKFAFHILKSVVRAEAPQGIVVNLGEKRGADQMGTSAAPPGAPGTKRQCLLSGSIGTSGGSNDEALGSEFSHEAAALENVCWGKWSWGEERKSAWWYRPGYTDADFKRDFHMSRSTFSRLCDILAPSVAKQDTAVRDAIPAPERVAVCVYRFATAENFRGLEKRFGICPSTCQKIVLDVTAAINAIFQAGSVSALWPHGVGAMDAAAAKFQDLTGGIPGVIGAVYTTHFPINQPKKDVVYYYNRSLTQRHKGKTSYSVSLQAAVDANGAFTDFCLGYPGATSDEEIFSLSSMSTTHAGEMVAQGKRLVGGTGYPLTDWTLVPYTDSNLTPPQETFNKKLALARGVALGAFRRLKARWAFLRMRAMGKLDVFSSVMAACCVLHNLCESSGDHLGDELKGYKLEDDEIVVDEPMRSDAAAQVRDAIAHNLYLQHAGAGGSMPF